MKNKIIYALLLNGLWANVGLFAQTGRVGIGTVSPKAGLDVSSNDGLISEGVAGSGNTDDLPTGRGTRLMWIPRKGAFRAGQTDGAEWNVENVGAYSFATGWGNKASGRTTVSLGAFNTAGGETSIAIGTNNVSTGLASIAMGYGSVANENFAVAIGYNAVANDMGAFVLADRSTSEVPVQSSAVNKFTARFANGYLLYTSADFSSFAALPPGGNAWVSSSDSTRKTNFAAADGELFLRKLRDLRLGSWNYKKQDPSSMRHYGPMAQEFFAAYGKDKIGVIGNDTTLNAADVDGVAFILLKALEKRTAELSAEVKQLKERLASATTGDSEIKTRLVPENDPATKTLTQPDFESFYNKKHRFNRVYNFR